MRQRPTVTVIAALSLTLATGGVAIGARDRPRCFGARATVVGTRHRDVLTGTEGDDVIVALSGNDEVDGRGGDDLVCGGRGSDALTGYEGHDRLSGARGNDVVVGDGGGGGFDELLGGPGHDTLEGGVADDRLDGGTGIDTTLYVEPAGPMDIDLNTGTASAVDGVDALVIGTIENVSIVTIGYCPAYDDHIVGDGAANTLYASNGNDTISGGDGADFILGGQPGAEQSDIVCVRQDGNDVLHGDEGDDTIYGQGNDDALDGGGGTDLVYGGAGTDSCAQAEQVQECES